MSEKSLLALDEVIEVTSLGQSSDNAIFNLTVELDEELSKAFEQRPRQGTDGFDTGDDNEVLRYKYGSSS